VAPAGEQQGQKEKNARKPKKPSELSYLTATSIIKRGGRPSNKPLGMETVQGKTGKRQGLGGKRKSQPNAGRSVFPRPCQFKGGKGPKRRGEAPIPKLCRILKKGKQKGGLGKIYRWKNKNQKRVSPSYTGRRGGKEKPIRGWEFSTRASNGNNSHNFPRGKGGVERKRTRQKNAGRDLTKILKFPSWGAIKRGQVGLGLLHQPAKPKQARKKPESQILRSPRKKDVAIKKTTPPFRPKEIDRACQQRTLPLQGCGKKGKKARVERTVVGVESYPPREPRIGETPEGERRLIARVWAELGWVPDSTRPSSGKGGEKRENQQKDSGLRSDH